PYWKCIYQDADHFVGTCSSRFATCPRCAEYDVALAAEPAQQYRPSTLQHRVDSHTSRQRCLMHNGGSRRRHIEFGIPKFDLRAGAGMIVGTSAQQPDWRTEPCEAILPVEFGGAIVPTTQPFDVLAKGGRSR